MDGFLNKFFPSIEANVTNIEVCIDDSLDTFDCS